MAKTVTEERDDRTSHEAIKPQKLIDLIGKVANANNALDNARTKKGELIADAVENQNLHKGAFALFMKLRKMDPVQRDAFRFHLEVYCEREWGKNTDLLRVTGEQPAEEDGADDGEPDLRPDYLKSGSAAAPAPRSSATARVRELADKAEANLSVVGRGPQASKPN